MLTPLSPVPHPRLELVIPQPPIWRTRHDTLDRLIGQRDVSGVTLDDEGIRHLALSSKIVCGQFCLYASTHDHFSAPTHASRMSASVPLGYSSQSPSPEPSYTCPTSEPCIA